VTRFAKYTSTIILLAVIAFSALIAYQLIAVRGTFAPSRPVSEAGGAPILVDANGHRMAGRAYTTGAPSSSAPLVIVLHGDAPFVNPGYQYAFASHLANAVPGTRVVAVLRPGYADPYGAKSDGNRGFAIGENYTLDDIGRLASAIQSLKAQWQSPSVIIVGHSGGAVLAADIAALNPGLVKHAFLIGCPCDVPAFRRHMAQLQSGPLWLLPVHSLSPLQTLDQMNKTTAVTAISGSNDPLALPQYAQAYIAKAGRLGISAEMILLPGKGHEILNDGTVLDRVAASVRSDP
jgi:poly(3-hydroxybutyrate) depolymerase